MNKFRFLIALSTILLAAASLSWAYDGEKKHRMKLLVSGGEPIEIEDLAVGESRQYFGEDGKEILVVREEHGYKLTVDGREIDLISSEHPPAMEVVLSDEEGESVNVFVKKMISSEDAGRKVVFISEDGAGEPHGAHDVLVWNQDEDGEESHAFTFMTRHESVLDQVLESGVLDQVDDSVRQELIEVIKKAESRRILRTDSKVIVLDDDESEE